MKTKISNRLRLKSGSPERGQSLVEFALLAPILIILVLGMCDFGWILHQQIQMDNAARLGARRGAVGVTSIDINKRMRDIVTFPLLESEISIDVLDSSGVSIGNPDDRTQGNMIRVRIDRKNVDFITPLGGFIDGLTTVNLNSETEFLIE